VKMQEAGGTFPRIALLSLVAAGMLGAIALLLYLGVRLVLAGMLALILLLFAPAMLLAPAFGESGRAAFLGWCKRLIGALAAKLVYALLLALVLVAASAIAAVGIGWFATWLLQLAFWWGILLKRKELVGFLSVGRAAAVRGTAGGRSLRRDVRAAGAAVGSVGRRAKVVGGAPVVALAGRGFARAQAGREGVQVAAREELEERTDRALRLQLEGARTALARNDELEQELRDTNRGLTKYDTLVQAHKEWAKPPPSPSDKEAALLRRRDVLAGSKHSTEATQQAKSIVGTADRNLALTGREFSDADRAALLDQRRRDVESGLSPEHERSLRFSGIDPRVYDRASSEQRTEMRARAREAAERDQRLLGAVSEQGRPEPRPRDLRHARIELSPERLRERTRERRQIRKQARRQPQRERVYRRR
jgi:hypothetical protein